MSADEGILANAAPNQKVRSKEKVLSRVIVIERCGFIGGLV